MASSRTRGRLPQRVYWVRRSVVVLVALVLVFAIAKLIGGTGSDPAPAADKASQAAASSGASSPVAAQTMGPVAPSQTTVTQNNSKAALIPPSGPCNDDEVSVLPVVSKASAGAPIVLHLRLEGTQPACTFAVSPDSLVVKIVSGSDRIWSTQDCPQAIRPSSVVVRSGLATDVPVTWSGRRSDDTCSTSTAWALPGFYHLYAAALGSAPADLQFEVTLPNRRVITRTAHPHPRSSASASATATPRSTATKKPTATSSPTASPTGKHHGGSVCGGDNAAGTC